MSSRNVQVIVVSLKEENFHSTIQYLLIDINEDHTKIFKPNWEDLQ